MNSNLLPSTEGFNTINSGRYNSNSTLEQIYLMSTPSALVQQLWNYCNILRDDGRYFEGIITTAH